MAKSSADLPNSPRHVHIIDEDWKYLDKMFGRPGGMKPIGVSKAIQMIVHSKILELRAKESQMRDARAVIGDGEPA